MSMCGTVMIICLKSNETQAGAIHLYTVRRISVREQADTISTTYTIN